MNVRWSKTALIELENIFIYISARNRTAAKTVVDRIETLTDRLGQFPLLGPAANETQVRTLPVVRYPFVIFYAIDQAYNEVVILHVRHTAQQLPQAD